MTQQKYTPPTQWNLAPGKTPGHFQPLRFTQDELDMARAAFGETGNRTAAVSLLQSRGTELTRAQNLVIAATGTTTEAKELKDGERSVDGPVIALTEQSAKSDQPVWTQLAVLGAWKGHTSGEFSITTDTLDEICRNFTADGLPVPIDMEHASEQDATSGSIPLTGAPAHGWIHRLQNRGAAGLWGLVEWLEPAKTYIRSGQYRYLSPAIRFGCRDRVTGKPVGAKLSSAALTNQPFLKSLARLAAKDAPPKRELSFTRLKRRLMSEGMSIEAAEVESARLLSVK